MLGCKIGISPVRLGLLILSDHGLFLRSRGLGMHWWILSKRRTSFSKINLMLLRDSLDEWMTLKAIRVGDTSSCSRELSLMRTLRTILLRIDFTVNLSHLLKIHRCTPRSLWIILLHHCFIVNRRTIAPTLILLNILLNCLLSADSLFHLLLPVVTHHPWDLANLLIICVSQYDPLLLLLLLLLLKRWPYYTSRRHIVAISLEHRIFLKCLCPFEI